MLYRFTWYQICSKSSPYSYLNQSRPFASPILCILLFFIWIRNHSHYLFFCISYSRKIRPILVQNLRGRQEIFYMCAIRCSLICTLCSTMLIQLDQLSLGRYCTSKLIQNDIINVNDIIDVNDIINVNEYLLKMT